MVTSDFAPIVLFTYNRLWHTQQTIEALKNNELAINSNLFIFSDGSKENDIESVSQVRAYLKSINGFNSVTIIERSCNYGLAKNIISGVSEVINKFGKVIVLEDDIVTSKGFLRYMNGALYMYQKELNVGCIHSWNYHLNTSHYKESTFFLKGGDCWGWATWERSWNLFNPDAPELLSHIKRNHLQYQFNRRGTHQYVKMLEDQIAGKNDSWAIRWHASLFLEDKYCLHPTNQIVRNIGLDNSGIHCEDNQIYQEPIDFIDLRKIPICDSTWFYRAYLDYIIHTYPKKNICRISLLFLKKLFLI